MADKIRRRVVFEYLNLALDFYPSFAAGVWGMNLIMCRNVLIYFDRETIRGVARRLYDSLAPGGWLFTAASDPPLAQDAPFETVGTDAGVFYRRSTGTPSAFAATAFAPSPALPVLPLPPPVQPELTWPTPPVAAPPPAVVSAALETSDPLAERTARTPKEIMPAPSH